MFISEWNSLTKSADPGSLSQFQTSSPFYKIPVVEETKTKNWSSDLESFLVVVPHNSTVPCPVRQILFSKWPSKQMLVDNQLRLPKKWGIDQYPSTIVSTSTILRWWYSQLYHIMCEFPIVILANNIWWIIIQPLLSSDDILVIYVIISWHYKINLEIWIILDLCFSSYSTGWWYHINSMMIISYYFVLYIMSIVYLCNTIQVLRITIL